MKIIQPEAIIIEEELSKLSFYQRIEQCAAICYQRPAKPKEEESIEFCRSMVKRGHLTTLEMAQVHLVVELVDCSSNFGKYINVQHNDFYSYSVPNYIVSGSIRAFMESWHELTDDMKILLSNSYPDLFGVNKYLTEDFFVRFAKPQEIPRSHQYVAVRVVCSRSISHQLVRHRPFSFLQESQRYCRYEDGVTVI